MNVLYWLRSDLRLHDNAALCRFQNLASEGLILWCPSRSQRRSGPFRQSFIWASVQEVAERLRALGAQVCIEARDIREVLPPLLQVRPIDRIIFSDEACIEEQQDAQWVAAQGIPCEVLDTRLLLDPSTLPFTWAAWPEVFTTFRKKVEAKLHIPALLPSPRELPGAVAPIWPLGLTAGEIAARITHHHPQIAGGEAAGLQRLDEYVWTLDRLKTYKETRDGLLDWNDSSKLSAWLAVGALSTRQVYWEIRRYEESRLRNESTYWLFFELLWRDYFYGIAKKWGGRLFTGMRDTKKPGSTADPFLSWQLGQSGQPFIDAHMNELRATGWMSNRGRQNVANYFVKTLGGDWKAGAAYFEQQLIDYDAASNWGNWAYQAGVGQDSRDRRFDPVHQAQLYDPEDLYIRRWGAESVSGEGKGKARAPQGPL